VSTAHITVYLVDDHRLFRAGVRSELGQHVHIVGDAGDVDAAIQGIRRLKPDVVLLDVHMPGGGGRAVIEGSGRPTPTRCSSPCRSPTRPRT
jgi:DNA-binding NarL/FixJ family response regulator